MIAESSYILSIVMRSTSWNHFVLVNHTKKVMPHLVPSHDTSSVQMAPSNGSTAALRGGSIAALRSGGLPGNDSQFESRRDVGALVIKKRYNL